MMIMISMIMMIMVMIDMNDDNEMEIDMNINDDDSNHQNCPGMCRRVVIWWGQPSSNSFLKLLSQAPQLNRVEM